MHSRRAESILCRARLPLEPEHQVSYIPVHGSDDPWLGSLECHLDYVTQRSKSHLLRGLERCSCDRALPRTNHVGQASHEMIAPRIRGRLSRSDPLRRREMSTEALRCEGFDLPDALFTASRQANSTSCRWRRVCPNCSLAKIA